MKGLCFLYLLWRRYNMYKQTMGFLRGIGTGVIAGVAVSVVGAKMMRDNRRIRRSANKAMRAVGGLMDNVTVLFR